MNISTQLLLVVTGPGLQNPVCFTPPGSPVVNANAPSGAPATPISLAAGNNAIPVPAGAVYLVLSPPAGSTNVKWAGAEGTGWQLDPANPALLPIPSGVTTVNIYSAAAETCGACWG